MTNLKNFTTYNLAISAVTSSKQYPGKLYESQFSSYHQIFVSPSCDVSTEMVSVFARDGINMLLVAVVLAVITSIILILGIAVFCKRQDTPKLTKVILT